MANPPGEPSGELDWWSVAGYGDLDYWYTVEGDKADSPAPTADELADALDLVVHVKDSDGVDWYFTLHGPWENYDDLQAEIYDTYEEYGGEAA